jgi:hypothetical protein
MSVIRATIYLKSGSGPKPYRTCYFSKREYNRLIKDFEQHQQTGSPKEGTYLEELSGKSEHSVFLEFEAIAHIKISSESKR